MQERHRIVNRKISSHKKAVNSGSVGEHLTTRPTTVQWYHILMIESYECHSLVRTVIVPASAPWPKKLFFKLDQLSYFLFQPVLHNWCNKCRGMCYPVCWMVHTKEPLLLIGNSSLCSGGSGFLLSLSGWSFTICPTPYKRKYKCV